jgi:hypothetical protein
MTIKLNLSQRLWLIEAIGSLPSSTALIKEADGFIGLLAPKDAEVSVEGLNFSASEAGLTWDLEVEAKTIPQLEVEIPTLTFDALKVKYSTRLKDPTALDLEMLSILGF